MFSNTTPQSLPLLPRPRSAAKEPQLPRGECRFILPEVDADGSRQRCSCVSFNLNSSVPGAQCGCGHQAWHHIPEPAGNYVPMDEHLALVDKAKRLEDSVRRLQEELSRERRERERAESNMVELTRGNYKNMALLRYYVDEKVEALRITQDDKLEGILDKAQGASDEVDKLKNRFSDLDEATIRLEEKVDARQWHSRSLTPVHETHPEASSSTPIPAVLPIRSTSDEKHADGWSCRVILVLSKNQPFAFEVESIGYRRCQSRGLHHDVHMQDHGSEAFARCVDTAFASILHGRLWMPLQCLRSEDGSLAELPRSRINPLYWDYVFLEEQCLAHVKLEGDVIYIALRHEELSWHDVHSLPRVFGSDESVWEHDDSLDSRSSSIEGGMDFQMTPNLDKPAHDFAKPIDSDSIYEFSPPPYSSRHPSVVPGAFAAAIPSALDVLAGTASYMRDNRSSHTNGSEEHLSLGGGESDDEHRDKRKRIGLLAAPGVGPAIPTTAAAAAAAAAIDANRPPQFIYSGRTKRKIPPGKPKEPLDWRTSEIKLPNPMKGFMHKGHHHDAKGKGHAAADQQSPSVAAPPHQEGQPSQA